MDEALRKLWGHGQVESSSDAAADALFAGSDQAADVALDEIAESPRMAGMVKVVAGLRPDAEALSREIKQLRLPRPARPALIVQRWPWAVAASVALVVWSAMPRDAGTPTLADPVQPGAIAQSSMGPAAAESPSGRILAASFETAAEREEPKLFSAGFDS